MSHQGALHNSALQLVLFSRTWMRTSPDVAKCLVECTRMVGRLASFAFLFLCLASGNSLVTKFEAMSFPKLRILCLHGKLQNKDVFRTKLGRIPHKLKNIAELAIVDAPFVFEIESSKESVARTWFFRKPETNFVEVDSLLESMNVLESIWKETGPFDGVLGFSMGGTVASLMAGSTCVRVPNDTGGVSETLERFPGLKFVICVGAVDIQSQLEQSIVELNLPFLFPFKIPAEIASLHIAGIADTVVPIASSIALSDRYVQPQFIQHEQGHHIPMKAEVLRSIVEFVTAQQARIHTSAAAVENSVLVEA